MPSGIAPYRLLLWWESAACSAVAIGGWVAGGGGMAVARKRRDTQRFPARVAPIMDGGAMPSGIAPYRLLPLADTDERRQCAMVG